MRGCPSSRFESGPDTIDISMPAPSFREWLRNRARESPAAEILPVLIAQSGAGMSRDNLARALRCAGPAISWITDLATGGHARRDWEVHAGCRPSTTRGQVRSGDDRWYLKRLAAHIAHGGHGGPRFSVGPTRPTAPQRPTWANVGAHERAVASPWHRLLGSTAAAPAAARWSPAGWPPSSPPRRQRFCKLAGRAPKKQCSI
jgi:hypothetical protein